MEKHTAIQVRPESTLGSHAGITVACNNLSYTVDTREGPRQILDGVTAAFRPGRLAIIMGASGSGKTTLLNILANIHKKDKTHLSGQVKYNGKTLKELAVPVKDFTGFVQQDDVLHADMTVSEVLYMSATLRLKHDPNGHKSRVEEIIDTLELHNAKDTLIGTSIKKGVSGGERKRTSFGMELITHPSILFLDEPTSGLDTFTASHVMKVLKRLAADKGCTIIATIHQPNSEMFVLADDLLLLDVGKSMYCGPIEDVVEFFGSHGYQCPQFYNPADYIFLEIINNTGEYKKTKQERCDKLITDWLASKENSKLETILYEPPRDIDSSHLRCNPGFATQFGYLFKMYSGKVYTNKKTVMTMVIYMLYSLVVSIPTLLRISTLSGAFIVIVFAQSVLVPTYASLTFIQDRVVFLREFTQGYYSAEAFLLAKTLPYSIWLLVSSLVITVISSTALRFLHDTQTTIAQGVLFYLYLVIGALSSQYISHSVGILLPHETLAILLSMTIILFWLASGLLGLLKHLITVPDGLLTVLNLIGKISPCNVEVVQSILNGTVAWSNLGLMIAFMVAIIAHCQLLLSRQDKSAEESHS